MTGQSARPATNWPFASPAWWQATAWAVVVVVSALAPHSAQRRWITAVLMVVAALAYFASQHRDVRVRATSLVLATGAGLAATVIAPGGLGEVPVLLAASRIPAAFGGRTMQVVTVLDSIAFGATIGWTSRSLGGLAAGIGVPLLVQRAVQRQDLIVERDRAQALLAEVQAGRDAEAQGAALRERSRIATEMHDVLAHSLAGLSVQLQAVRAIALRHEVGDEVLEPLNKAAGLAKDGLEEAKAVVGALRNPIGLGVDALPNLIERHPGTVHLDTTGDPGRVAPEAGHAVYRAVQEALTNAARYAPGSSVRVSLAWHPESLEVTVADSGPLPGRSAMPGQGTGLGLAGMDERIRVAGGTLTAGPSAAGGWQVRLNVPVEVRV